MSKTTGKAAVASIRGAGKPRPLLGVEARREAGRALRNGAPRSSHAKFSVQGKGRDAVAMLEASNRGRVASLVPIRYGRMLHSPFAFLRGAAAIMAFNLSRTPVSGIGVQACGDAMAPKRPGPSSAYLSAYKDKAGQWLDGGKTYRLRVPPNAPIKLFWSVTVYDVDTRALILNDQKIADRSSRMDLRTNDDGSVDIYCGPTPPNGFEKNWIPTVPRKNWFAYFRFYNPTAAYFDRSWPLPDFEETRPN